MAAGPESSVATLRRDQHAHPSGSNMNHQKIEALGRPRTLDSVAPRLLTLSQPHHFSTKTGTTESLFDYGDGIALLQHCELPAVPYYYSTSCCSM
jgi:hypothetical protein